MNTHPLYHKIVWRKLTVDGMNIHDALSEAGTICEIMDEVDNGSLFNRGYKLLLEQAEEAEPESVTFLDCTDKDEILISMYGVNYIVRTQGAKHTWFIETTSTENWAEETECKPRFDVGPAYQLLCRSEKRYDQAQRRGVV